MGYRALYTSLLSVILMLDAVMQILGGLRSCKSMVMNLQKGIILSGDADRQSFERL